MAGSHTPTSEHHTPVDASPLTLVSTVEHGLSARLAGRVDGHLTAFAEHMREGLLAASTAVGLEVMAELIDAEVTELAGPKGRHDPDRTVVRHGTEAGSVTLGGRRVPVRRPRVRTIANGDGEPAREVALESYTTLAATDLLAEGIVARMLAGISTRRYPVALEPVGAQVERAARSTSKSAVSRRFVAATAERLAELCARPLADERCPRTSAPWCSASYARPGPNHRPPRRRRTSTRSRAASPASGPAPPRRCAKASTTR